ncbi:MAG: DUF3052 domain-containing protein [Aquisalinus sp.]|nr:DUF3052 domain-containing protein [Aquisalinus sp.]
MPLAGYSGTPLLKKLGYKDGQKALLLGVPPELPQLSTFSGFAACKQVKTWRGLSGGPYDLIHVFEKQANNLESHIDPLRQHLEQSGMIWVSWPKKASKVPTTVTEDVIRRLALDNGLVDVKVCAVNEVWSGLKLVIPVKDRK